MAAMHNPAHPGEILKNEFQDRSITDVARHLGVARVTLSRILNRQAGVTPEMSIRLSQALNTSPDFWYRMQTQFDFWKASQKRRKRIPPLGKAA